MPTAIISDNTTGAYSGTYAGMDDAAISSNVPNTNFGASATLTTINSTTVARSLLRATGLSNLPAGAMVTSATLGLYLQSGGAQFVDVNKLLRNWVEAQATYNIFGTGNNWATAGAAGADTDIASTAIAQMSVTATAGWKTVANAALAGWIQSITNGGGNNGVRLSTAQTTDNTWTSSEGTNGQRPYVQVVYNEPPAGKSFRAVAAGFSTAIDSLVYGWAIPPAIDDLFFYDSSEITVNADLTWSTTKSKGVIHIQYWDQSDYQLKSFNINLGASIIINATFDGAFTEQFGDSFR